MPATIAEIVFMISPYEGALLFSGTGRHQQVAESLEASIVNYIEAP
jgi:N-acetylmuramoyl-L-alanine amidase